jgi:hypothetical protein
MSNSMRQYRTKGSVKKREVERSIKDAWIDAITNDPKARKLLGLPVGKTVPAALKAAPYRVKKRAGADPASATLLIMLGATAIRFANRALQNVWDGIVFPRLKKFSLQTKPAKPKKAANKKAAKKKRSAI